MAELLEDAVAQAADGTRAALREALQPGLTENAEAASQTAKVRARVARAIEAALDRFTAYARGVIEGGAVPDFFRHQLPRLRLEIAAIRDVLVRRAPVPEEPLFVGLKRDLDGAFKDAAAALADAAADETMRALIHEERITQVRSTRSLAPSRRSPRVGRLSVGTSSGQVAARSLRLPLPYGKALLPRSATLTTRAEEGRPPAVDASANGGAALDARFALPA